MNSLSFLTNIGLVWVTWASLAGRGGALHNEAVSLMSVLLLGIVTTAAMVPADES
jgi:hypothetical protein